MALVGVLLGVLFCIAPTMKLGEIAGLWWKWHDVPGASINNLEEIHYEIGNAYFPNSVKMYVVIFGQIAVGLTAIGASIALALYRQRQE